MLHRMTALGGDVLHRPTGAGRHLDQARHRPAGVDSTEDVTLGHRVADSGKRPERPLLGGPRRGTRTGRQPGRRVIQRAQQPVEHAAQQPGTELDRQRLTPALHCLPGGEPAGVLERLQRRERSADGDDLGGDPVGSELDDVVHRHLSETLGLDERSVDPGDRPAHGRHSSSTRAPIASRARSAAASRLSDRRRPAVSARTPPSGCSRTTAPDPRWWRAAAVSRSSRVG